MKIRVVTLFPEMMTAALGFGVCGRALQRRLAEVAAITPRDFTADTHRTVRAARDSLPVGARVVFLSPQGRRFDQALARDMVGWPGLVLVAGRYEGFDERLLEAEADDEISLGDFVLSGGEVAALAVIDAVVRLLPGVLGDDASAEQESFTDGLLDCPHYTRPEDIDGRRVPSVLLEGDHQAIRRWRLKQSLARTSLRRPDLLERRQLSAYEKELLREYQTEQAAPGQK